MSITDCSSGFQSSSISPWPTATPATSTPSTINLPDIKPATIKQTTIGTIDDSCNMDTINFQTLLPPPSLSPQSTSQITPHLQPPNHHMSQLMQPQQLPDLKPADVVEEFEKIMTGLDDNVVLANSVCLLFRFSIDSLRGPEVCQAVSSSSIIMDRLYSVLTSNQFRENDDFISCYATGNLAIMSKYEQGRAAILGYTGSFYPSIDRVSPGVASLLRSIQSRDSNVVIFAITALHNLLLDRRAEFQDMAKAQIKYGIGNIVQLLDDNCLIQNYEFKVIVLDCLQILAYKNRENRLAIKEKNGAYQVLNTINKSLDRQPTDELIDTASRVLKSLSACPDIKKDIIENGGIDILTTCISTSNQEILKTSLWTLRNLSDLISIYSGQELNFCIHSLLDRLLHILDEYVEEQSITSCALGILANLSCNNESIKRFICRNRGVQLILNTIEVALRDSRDFRIVGMEVLEPAICALCHLMNQNQVHLADDVRLHVSRNRHLIDAITSPARDLSEDLAKAVQRLYELTYARKHEMNSTVAL